MDDRYKAVPGVILTSVCGRFFLVAPEESLEINDITAYYWSLLEKGTCAGELAEAAVKEYEIKDVAGLTEDIRNLLQALRERHLIMRYRI